MNTSKVKMTVMAWLFTVLGIVNFMTISAATFVCLFLVSIPNDVYATSDKGPLDITLTAEENQNQWKVKLTVNSRIDVEHAKIVFETESKIEGALTLIEIVHDAKTERESLEIDLGNLVAKKAKSKEIVIAIKEPGKHILKGWVHILDNSGNSIFAQRGTLYILADSLDDVRFGKNGFVNLEIEKLNESGLDKDSNTFYSKLWKILGFVEPTSSSNVIAMTKRQTKRRTRAKATNITVKGKALWTDSAGKTHPIRHAKIEVFDSDFLVFFSPILGETKTNDKGEYSIVVNGKDQDDDPDIYVVVYAKTDYIEVTPGIPKKYIVPPSYRLNSQYFWDTPSNKTISVPDLIAGNTEDNHTAFSVLDALVEASLYASTLSGITINSLAVRFPHNQSKKTSYFTQDENSDGKTDDYALKILQLDRYDWDVLHHEYGHYVSKRGNVANRTSTGGSSHGSCENLMNARSYSKEHAIQLAFSEGWPTFFALSLQKERNTASLRVPNAGDLFYQDTEDCTISDDIESQGCIGNQGEDNEETVTRILWDLYDSSDDDGDTKVALGDKAIWKALRSTSANTLSKAWESIVNSRPAATRLEDSVKYAAIFSEHKVSPKLTAPADEETIKDTSTPLTFKWESNGAGKNHRLNQFTIEFYENDFSGKPFFTKSIKGDLKKDLKKDSKSYTPSKIGFILPSDWETISSSIDIKIRWVVRGKNTEKPITGPYLSPAHTLYGRCYFDDLDISDTSDPTKKTPGFYKTSVKKLCEEGIIGGTGNGKFEPNRKKNHNLDNFGITKAEFLKIVLLASLDHPAKESDYDKDKGKTPFPDVTSLHWADGFIEYAKNHKLNDGNGIIVPKSDGTFGPNDEITRKEAAKMVVRSVESKRTRRKLLLGKIPTINNFYGIYEDKLTKNWQEDKEYLFEDVKDSNDHYYYYIYTLGRQVIKDVNGNAKRKKGEEYIINGYGKKFGPDKTIRRGEAAKMLCYAFYGEMPCKNP
ncbi:MAG: S-layer homology domain-containing protein [Candidatus Parabeggiatoa sp.]|nr:S-layer homology domain-containing protein [Candidatus Parabeggiatoa sp.]